jgi:cysteine desulfurase
MHTIYFDNAATTALDPGVFKAMLPFFGGQFGNPSSMHRVGRQARQAVENSRAELAALLNASPEEIVFTASGTESDNMALRGIAEQYGPGECHVIASAIEHPAILETCQYLKRHGVEITLLSVDSYGMVSPDRLQQALRPNTRLVTVHAAHNEVGTVQPIDELGRIARSHGALFHTDAVQAVGKIPLDMAAQPVDMLSLSGHKIHGPKGVGALYIRKGVSLAPLIHGGGQERGLRSATENVAGIVGLGAAAKIAAGEMAQESVQLRHMRDRLIAETMRRVPNAYLLGHPRQRLPGNICLGFAGQENEAIKVLLALDEAGIAVSSGSACGAHHAGQPSASLLAMGLDAVRARGSLRITLGRFNTEEEVDCFLHILPDIISALRPMSTRFSPGSAGVDPTRVSPGKELS